MEWNGCVMCRETDLDITLTIYNLSLIKSIEWNGCKSEAVKGVLNAMEV
jgi:hypothetical protein